MISSEPDDKTAYLITNLRSIQKSSRSLYHKEFPKSTIFWKLRFHFSFCFILFSLSHPWSIRLLLYPIQK